MKKLVLLPVLALLSVSTFSFSADSGNRDQLLQQGIQAVKANDLRKASQIEQNLRSMGAARQAQALKLQIARKQASATGAALQEETEERNLLERDYKNRLQELRTDVNALRDENKEVYQELDRVNADNLVLRTKLADAENMLIELDEGIAEVKKKYEDYSEKIAQLTEENQKQKEEYLKQLEQKDVTGEIAKLKGRVSDLEAQNMTLEDDLLKTREDLFQANVKNDTLKNNVKQLQDVMKASDKQYKDRVAKLESQVDSLLIEKQKLESDLFARAGVIDGLKEEVVSLNNIIDSMKKQ